MRNQFKGGFVRSWKPAKSMNDIVWQPSGTKGLQRSVVKWLNEHILNCHPGSEARDARDPALLQRRGFGTHSLLTLQDYGVLSEYHYFTNDKGLK